MVLKTIIAYLFLCGVAVAQTLNPPIPQPPIPVVYGTPSIATNAAAGAGATATIVGNNVTGAIVVTTGSGTLSNAVLATITFGGTDLHTSCLLTPANTNAVGQAAMIYAVQPVGNAWSIGVGGSPVQSSFSYIWGYQCT